MTRSQRSFRRHHTLLPMLTAAASAPAQTAYPLTTEHVDLAIEWAGAWSVTLADDDSGVDRELDRTLIRGRFGPDSGAVLPRPSGDQQWGFFGTPAGASLWILPQGRDPLLPWLGIGAENNVPGDFTGSPRVRVDAVRGPGAFSLYRINFLGQPEPLVTSADGIAAGGEAIDVPGGSHIHVAWAFTAPGRYEIDLVAAGRPAGEASAVVSDPFTLVVEVSCEADTTGDAAVDVFDILGFFAEFGAGYPSADVTLDGRLDVFDIVGYFAWFSRGCP